MKKKMFSSFLFIRKKNKGEKKGGNKFKVPMKQSPRKISERPPKLEDIPDLLDTLLNSNDKKRVASATKTVVDLSDTRNQHNRIRMVCSQEYNVLPALIQCFKVEGNETQRILALAVLLNLSSSPESRRGIANGPFLNKIIDSLCNILLSSKSRDELQGLSLRCLRNLSMAFSAPSIKTLLKHSPPPPPPPLQKDDDYDDDDGKEVHQQAIVLNNPKSLLRVLETLLKNPHLPPQQQLVACDLVHNLTFSRENAKLIAKTQIPELILDKIRESIVSPLQWESGSLEKVALFAIRNLGRLPECRNLLISIGTLEVMKAIVDSKKNKVVLLNSSTTTSRTTSSMIPQQQQVQNVPNSNDSSSSSSVATTVDLTVQNDDAISLGPLNISSDSSVATTADLTLQNDDDMTLMYNTNIPTRTSQSNLPYKDRHDDASSLGYPVPPALLENRPSWTEIDRIPCWVDRKCSKGWVLGIMTYQAPQKR